MVCKLESIPITIKMQTKQNSSHGFCFCYHSVPNILTIRHYGINVNLRCGKKLGGKNWNSETA